MTDDHLGKTTNFCGDSEHRSARQNLFNRDLESSLDDLAKEREEFAQTQEQQFSDKWNFQLSTGTPMEGQFEWGECIPLNQRTPLLRVPRYDEEASPASTSCTSAGAAQDVSKPSMYKCPSGEPSSSSSSADIATSSSYVLGSEDNEPCLKRPRPLLPEESTDAPTSKKSPKR